MPRRKSFPNQKIKMVGIFEAKAYVSSNVLMDIPDPEKRMVREYILISTRV
jgi:hypothetical protein